MRRRWLVRCVARNGEVLTEDRFWLSRRARTWAAELVDNAEVRDLYSPRIRAIMDEHGPLYRVEVIRAR